MSLGDFVVADQQAIVCGTHGMADQRHADAVGDQVVVAVEPVVTVRAATHHARFPELPGQFRERLAEGVAQVFHRQSGIGFGFGELHHLQLDLDLGQDPLAADAAFMAEAQSQGVVVVGDQLDGFLEQRNVDFTLDLQGHADVVVGQVRVRDLVEPDALLDGGQFVGGAVLRGQHFGRRIHFGAPAGRIN
ncbi:hypothetical protein SRABI112_05097 [Pseudomonas mediterranea]|nr:hypothetical protein SRABI112_05097 [Pseudomonas mediterranea]